ncbi:transposase [Streptomyces umbrinus]|uniref:transposase n=1 Tax=Streptomyces umbrinus TaxID=67370 RepID=UPI003594272C
MAAAGNTAAAWQETGRPPTWTRRQLIDGIRWRTRTGAPWRDVPPHGVPAQLPCRPPNPSKNHAYDSRTNAPRSHSPHPDRRPQAHTFASPWRCRQRYGGPAP